MIAFRLRELERQMREASAKEDFEVAIELRTKARELREEMRAEECEPPPKVVSILSGEAYAPTPGKRQKRPPRPKARPVCEDTVGLLEATLEAAREGLVAGVALVKGMTNQEGQIIDVFSESTATVIDHLPLFLGGLELCRYDLIKIEEDEADVDFE